jgi:hypothetical protein
MGSVPGDGKDASAAAKASADEKELLARGIRADRSADDPKQSLLDALGDYMVLCGGDPIDDKWRVEMKMRTNGGTAGSYDVYYFNPENVRFRSRAEAVRHYGLTPINAPKTASRSQPGGGGGGGGGGGRKPGETLEQVKARRDALEVRRVMDRMLGKVEHLVSVAANAERREAERAAARAEKAAKEAEEKAAREAKRAAEKAERDKQKQKEKEEKEKERALVEQKRLEEKAAREAEKEARKEEREKEKKERAEAREEEKREKEKAREARERRKAEDAEAKVREMAEAKVKGRWLRLPETPREDGEGEEVGARKKGPGTPPLAFSSRAFQNSPNSSAPSEIHPPKPSVTDSRAAVVPDALLISDPAFAGDAFEVWSFMDRFREVLFAENAAAAEGARSSGASASCGKRKRAKKKSKKAKALAAAAAAERARDERAPFSCMPPTPHALACAMMSDEDETAAAAVVGALLRPLLAQHAAATTANEAWASALKLAPFREAFFGENASDSSRQKDTKKVSENVSTCLDNGDVCWQEFLRRYLRGAASAMASPPEGGLLGSTARAAADAGETVCRWVVTGGPTCAPTVPETGTVLPPWAAAVMAADMERAPRPPAPMSAKADAEALVLCEAELYALGGDALEGPERSSGDDDEQDAVDERRREALATLKRAADLHVTNAVRQCVRVLAHEEAFRAPAVSRKASRSHPQPGPSGASSVPGYASVAGGAGFVTAARARYPRVCDYETIDARAAAGVYEVQALTLPKTQPLDAFLQEDAAECGELLHAAEAPKNAPRVVREKLEKARKRGAPEEDSVPMAEDNTMENAKDDAKDAQKDDDDVVVIRGRVYTLFGPKAGALPKAAWDDGCLCCGGDAVGGGVVLLCERCDGEYHARCLSPPLSAVPEDAWFCPACERSRGEQESEASEAPPAPSRYVRRALEGTRLFADASGALCSVRGSTKARTRQADRYLSLASRLTSKGGWAGLTPGQRMEILKELTHHLLECAPVRRNLDESEKKGNEARDALRRHVRDWPSFWKHGIGSAEAAVIVADARAKAEALEEQAEKRDAEAKRAKKAAEAKEKKARLGDGEENADETPDSDDDAEEMGHDADDDADDDEDAGVTKKGQKDGQSKSYRVRMAGADAARACLPTVAETEGRARWQARWHELEGNLRNSSSRLTAAGLDRAGRAYWLVGPWGELVCQPAGGDAGARACAPLGPGAAGGGGKKRKRKAGAGKDDDDEDDDGDDGDDDAAGDDDAGDAFERRSALTAAANALPSVAGGGKDVQEAPWGAYSGANAVASFAASLDRDGKREGALWTQLERRFGAPAFFSPTKDEDAKDEKDESASISDAREEEGEGGSDDEEEDDEAEETVPKELELSRELETVPRAPPATWAKLHLATKKEGKARRRRRAKKIEPTLAPPPPPPRWRPRARCSCSSTPSSRKATRLRPRLVTRRRCSPRLRRRARARRPQAPQSVARDGHARDHSAAARDGDVPPGAGAAQGVLQAGVVALVLPRARAASRRRGGPRRGGGCGAAAGQDAAPRRALAGAPGAGALRRARGGDGVAAGADDDARGAQRAARRRRRGGGCRRGDRGVRGGDWRGRRDSRLGVQRVSRATKSERQRRRRRDENKFLPR